MRDSAWFATATVAGVVASSVGCGTSDAFMCTSDAECSGGACVGVYCAFPDDTCASHLRYGAHAGSLSGSCAPPQELGSSESSAGSGPNATTTDASTTSGDEATVGLPLDSTGDGEAIGNFLFVDDDLGDFAAGTKDGVVYDGGRLRLASAGRPGTYTSRIFDAGVEAQWVTLRWEPDAPYAKALPDDQAVEQGYAHGAVDMTGNVLLHHFEESSPLVPGAVVLDTSGHDNHGQIVGGTPSGTVPGVFGLAMEDNIDAYDSVPVGSGDFDFGFAGFTWSIWLRFSHACTNNNVFMGVEDIVGGGDAEEHLWMGCTNDSWSECLGSKPVAHAAGLMTSQQTSKVDDGTVYCGPSGINDGQWHHMAVVRQDNIDATTRLYVDGGLAMEIVGAFSQPIVFDHDPDFAIGAFTGQTYDTSGTFDDAAVWTRPLSADEVVALYERGAARVAFEVRGCGDPMCADDPLFRGGADLVAGEMFTDPVQASGPGTPVSVLGLVPARFIQYRLRMDAWPLAERPAIASVTIVGQAR